MSFVIGAGDDGAMRRRMRIAAPAALRRLASPIAFSTGAGSRRMMKQPRS
jgi:hypothetical protein